MNAIRQIAGQAAYNVGGNLSSTRQDRSKNGELNAPNVPIFL